MNIGVNLLPFRKNLTGTGTYAYNIITELGKLDSENEYVLFTNKENSKMFSVEPLNFKTVVLPFHAQRILLRIFWEQVILLFYLRKHNIDLLFSPSVALPVLSRCKNIVSIHDLIPFHVENKYSILRSFYIKKMTHFAARKAERVLTVSINSRKDISKQCKISLQKIVVAYNSVSKSLLSPNKETWEDFKSKKHIPDHYILFLGTLEPGKNINMLIRAFKILKEKFGATQKLVIAGGKGWSFNSIFEDVKNLQIETDVIFPGFIPNSILAFLYKNADVFVLPSLYEGFGIPALEAMYFGVPVVVSNVAALPEVVGDAGKLVDPQNALEIASSLYEILNNPALRNDMIEKGYRQATKFSWKQSAELVLAEFLKLSKKDC